MSHTRRKEEKPGLWMGGRAYQTAIYCFPAPTPWVELTTIPVRANRPMALGMTIRKLNISVSSHTRVLNQIKEDGNWKAFPLDKTAQSLVYGVTEQTGTEETGIMVYQTGPYLTGEEGDPLVPEIREGYYRLIDRHAEAGETDLLDRASLNFTLALYDTERDTLYFCEMDS